MKIENQVCTIAQSQKLYDLGIRGESIFYHTESKFGILPKSSIDFKNGYVKNAFTVAELGVMLKGFFILPEYKRDCRVLTERKYCWLIATSPNDYPACAETEAEARAQFIIYLIENEFIPAEEVNQKLINEDETH